MSAPRSTERSVGAEPDLSLAGRLFDELRRLTGSEHGVTRMAYGPGEAAAHALVRREAEALGLSIRIDAACNLYMTLPGREAGPPVILGSHLDSVPRGGNFDGAAGVLLGLAVVAGFRRAGVTPPRDLTIMAIRAEESTWFPASYIGSRAAFGRLSADELDGVRRVTDGVMLGDAVAAAGGDPAALRRGEAFLDAAAVAAFLEVHIEQGPVLIARDLPVGIVTSIRGSFRYRDARCLGRYGHSGTTPREERRDAVRAVALLITRLDELWGRLAAAGEDLTVTFGKVMTDSAESAFSKVPGRADFCVDVRSASPETLERVRRELDRILDAVAREQRVTFEMGPMTGSEPAVMDRGLIDALSAVAAGCGVSTIEMPCGAGHDAAVFATIGVPSAMLLLRNQNGSHNPHESMEMEDFAVAARIVSTWCLDPFARRG